MNSYKKSGENSCKLLIMTATPFTNSPLELFNLINLFMENESEKITTDENEFKKQYMNDDNILSKTGVKNLANKLSGYISYLNREKDPTQFAQPLLINVPVLLSFIDEELRDPIYLKTDVEDDKKVSLKRLKKSQNQEYMMYKYCENLKYKPYKAREKAKSLTLNREKPNKTRKIKSR